MSSSAVRVFVATSAARGAALSELAGAVAMLGVDELRVLSLIATRLAVGASRYGALHVAADRRDWRHEADEELLDGCVYLACASMRRARDTSRASRPQKAPRARRPSATRPRGAERGSGTP